MQETLVQSLGRGGPLEKGMWTHSSFLAWRIPWTERPGGLQSMGLQRVRYDWVTNTCFDPNFHKWGQLRRKAQLEDLSTLTTHLLSPVVPRFGSVEPRLFLQRQTWSVPVQALNFRKDFVDQKEGQKLALLAPLLALQFQFGWRLRALPGPSQMWSQWVQSPRHPDAVCGTGFSGSGPSPPPLRFPTSNVSSTIIYLMCVFKSLPFKFKYICFKKATWHQNHKWKTSITSHK